MPVRLADAFVRKRAHTVPVNWRLADEPHGVSVTDPTAVSVYACPAAARVVGCMQDAVERGGRSGADNFPASPAPAVGSELTIAWATTAALARASTSFPSRSKTIDVTAGLQWSYPRWVCEAVLALVRLSLAVLALLGSPMSNLVREMGESLW